MNWYISIILLVLFTISAFTITVISTKKKYSPKLLFLILLLLLLALCLLAYGLEPFKSTDLYKHFNTIRRMQLYGSSITTSVDSLFVMKFIFLFIAKIDNLHFLPVISSLITFISFFYILYDETITKKESTFFVFYSLLIFFAFCNYYYVVAGIKTAISYSFLALGIYFLKKNKRALGYILFFASIFTHVSSVFLIILYWLSKQKFFQGKNKYWLILFMPLFYIVKYILSLFSLDFFQYIISKFELYETRGQMKGSFLTIAIKLIFSILLIFRTNKLLKNPNLTENEHERINFIDVISIFVVGSITITSTILDRFLVLVAFLMPSFIHTELKYNKKKTIILFDFFCSALLIAYYIVRLLTHTTFVLP